MPNYLYNGVELPELPEWDKTAYPNAFIYRPYETDETWLVCTDGWGTANPPPYPDFVIEDANFANYLLKDGAFVFDFEITTGDGVHEVYAIGLEDAVIWTNKDICYKLAPTEVILAASDPVPVGGEPEQPDPEQPETDLTNIDLYRKINGKPTKLTLYKKVGGKLIPLDEYTKEVKT